MHPKTTKCKKPVIDIDNKKIIIITLAITMIISLLINVIPILDYLLITRNNNFYVLIEKQKQKQ